MLPESLVAHIVVELHKDSTLESLKAMYKDQGEARTRAAWCTIKSVTTWEIVRQLSSSMWLMDEDQKYLLAVYTKGDRLEELIVYVRKWTYGQ